MKLYNLDRHINESQFKERVSDIILRLQTEYWEMVSAIDNHETRRQSREQAVLQHELNKRRVAVGISAPMEVSRTRAEVLQAGAGHDSGGGPDRRSTERPQAASDPRSIGLPLESEVDSDGSASDSTRRHHMEEAVGQALKRRPSSSS